MKVELDRYGATVKLGEVRLRTPGLTGYAELILPNKVDGKLRGPREEGNSREFEVAFEKEGVEWQQTLVISDTRETRTRKDVAGLRLATTEEPAIEIEVPAPEKNWGQFMLTVDEAGVATWNFAVSESEKGAVIRGGATRTYRIPRYVPRPVEPEAAKNRGLTRAVGKKLIKVLVFPLIHSLLGRLSRDFAAQWEKQYRPYGIRIITPENYQQAEGDELDAKDWKKLEGGPALLLVHGTFSRAHTAFAGLPKVKMEELCGNYKGRVFAFDHYTLSKDPLQNVQYFLEQMPEHTKLELDILCHSRGGLVSRGLAEKQSELSLGTRQLSVRRIVFVGVPNAGTILTDSQYLGELLNSYTNLLNFFPDNGVTEILEGIITVAKMLAIGAIEGLRGLQAMQPQGEFLKRLNQGPPQATCYYALASDFEPREPGFSDWAKDHLMDKIFQGAANDLVVPTHGVFAVEGSQKFPIAKCYIFPRERGISHTGFFAAQETQQYLLEWLS